jgi:hypothetical protein
MNDLPEPSNATPAISDAQIFLHTDAHLYCIAQKDDQTLGVAEDLAKQSHFPPVAHPDTATAASPTALNPDGSQRLAGGDAQRHHR